ncbi:hypothetical protein PBRA_004145, partial [Plasmodiophora brassicae]
FCSGGGNGDAPCPDDDVADGDLGVPETQAGEIKDAQLIFGIVWNNLTAKYTQENLAFPKDIMWLAGAPGAGKSLICKYIGQLRGITAEPIVISDLLNGPEIDEIKSSGKLVSDRVVVQLLFERLLQPQYSSGCIVDGFPRTRIQGECMKLLFDKMRELRTTYETTPHAAKFPRPIFHIMVLFVEEDISVERQLKRGKYVEAHNRLFKQTGIGTPIEIRKTDMDPELARRRYQEFKEHVYDSLQSVKNKFHFHFVDAVGTVEQVQERIRQELEYQSKMELSNDAFDLVRRIPLPKELTQNARHLLVQRLETYVTAHNDLFSRVINVMEEEFVQILRRQALLGRAIIRTENEIFREPLALDICLDLFSERGYTTVVDVQKRLTPERIENDRIVHREDRVFEFDISFDRPVVRFAI